MKLPSVVQHISLLLDGGTMQTAKPAVFRGRSRRVDVSLPPRIFNLHAREQAQASSIDFSDTSLNWENNRLVSYHYAVARVACLRCKIKVLTHQHLLPLRLSLHRLASDQNHEPLRQLFPLTPIFNSGLVVGINLCRLAPFLSSLRA